MGSRQDPGKTAYKVAVRQVGLKITADVWAGAPGGSHTFRKEWELGAYALVLPEGTMGWRARGLKLNLSDLSLSKGIW